MCCWTTSLTGQCQLGLADSSVQHMAAAGRREAMWALLTCQSQHKGDSVLCPGHLWMSFCCSTAFWRRQISILECCFQVPCVYRGSVQAATGSSLFFGIHSTSSIPELCLTFQAALLYNASSMFSWLMSLLHYTCSRNAELFWEYGLELNWPFMVFCTLIEN